MKIYRQSLQNRIIHWGVAISTFGLILTGIFQMPVAKRYGIANIWEWSGEYFEGLVLHYIFAIGLIFFGVYHIVYHSLKKEFDIIPKKGDIKNSYLVIKSMITKDQEPPNQKYLPEQRLAYVAIAFTLFILVFTGLIKTYKNLLGFDIANWAYFWAAQLHNLGMILIIILIIAHLAAFIPKINRFLLISMFSGKVDAKYTLKRHQLWKKGIKEANKVLKNGKGKNE